MVSQCTGSARKCAFDGVLNVAVCECRSGRFHEARTLRPQGGWPRVVTVGSTEAPSKKTAEEIKKCVVECGVVVINYSEGALEALMAVVLKLRGGNGLWCGMVRVPFPTT